MPHFFRFPHTPHIAWLAAGAPRDDKVLSPAEASALLHGEVVVEEKMDGANLGFSIAPDGHLRAQNRGQYLEAPFHGQFARLGLWLAEHEDRLFDGLEPHLMAFGEWCAARHSLDYATLPDWWLLFDIYDRSAGAFWSTRRRDAWARTHGFAVVRPVDRGSFTLDRLRQQVLTGASAYRDGPMEGVVIRQDDADWCLGRAKLVRPDFTQAIETHWRNRPLEWNRMAQVFDAPRVEHAR